VMLRKEYFWTGQARKKLLDSSQLSPLLIIVRLSVRYLIRRMENLALRL
jgi:hypothetical protein